MAGLEAEIAGLRDLSGPELRARWRAWLGGSPPARLPHHLLLRVLAYRRQASAFGDLNRDSVRLLARIAGGDPVPNPETAPRPGSVLVREWKGVRHHVMVQPPGYAWDGRSFRSLSEVARAITGTSWNGPKFFGLRDSDPESQNGRRAGR